MERRIDVVLPGQDTLVFCSLSFNNIWIFIYVDHKVYIYAYSYIVLFMDLFLCSQPDVFFGREFPTRLEFHRGRFYSTKFEAEKIPGVKGIFLKSRNLFKFFEIFDVVELFLVDENFFYKSIELF